MAITARIYFHKCIIDVQKMSSDVDFLSSRIFFSVTVINSNAPSGKNVIGFDSNCLARQPHGEDYFENSIEVELPENLPVKLPYIEFSNEVEAYLRTIVEREEATISVKDSKNITIKNFTSKKTKTATLDLIESGGGW